MTELGAIFAALFVAHQLGDHWIQTDEQARDKGADGRFGQFACLRHVATYTATLTAFLLALIPFAGWDGATAGQWIAAGAVNVVTHYFADRRWPLEWLAVNTTGFSFWYLGKPRFGKDDNPSLGTGAYALDQSWHYLWLFVCALILAA